jgi:hypothetical protein
MTEMPTIMLMLSGAGLLLMGLRRPPSGQRFWLLATAALLFNLAASFHTTAWPQLVAILAAVLVYAGSRWGRAGRFRLGHGLLFSLAASAYCGAWLIGCWIKFGTPFQTFRLNSVLLVRQLGYFPLGIRLAAYPQSIAFTLKSVLPLLGFGIAWSWLAGGRDQPIRRCVLAVIGLALLLMMASTLNGAVSTQCYRSTIVLATALVPFMAAPFFPRLGSMAPAAQTRPKPLPRAQKLIVWGLAISAGFFYLRVNYQNVVERLDWINNSGANGVAMGAWLRQELIRPRILRPRNLALPLRIHNIDVGNAKVWPVIYGAGALNRLEIRNEASPETLRPGQVLISPTQIKDPCLAVISNMGPFFIYERLERPPSSLDKVP